MKVPSDYHFIFGLTRQDKEFALVHYLAIASCHAVNHPATINLYYKYEPSGIWWERAKPYLNLVEIEPPAEIFGNPLPNPSHKADVLRLQILLERGGVYLDVDVICLRPFAPLQDFAVVMGEELGVGLCNAVILAQPGAALLRRWLAAYTTFDAAFWNRHSVRLPRQLADREPAGIHVVDHRKFFWPMYWREHLEAFFLHPGSSFCSESYCVHLWESLTWPQLRSLTAAQLWTVDSEFSLLARPYIDPAWVQPPPAGGDGPGSA
jgi:hypothetical protein